VRAAAGGNLAFGDEEEIAGRRLAILAGRSDREALRTKRRNQCAYFCRSTAADGTIDRMEFPLHRTLDARLMVNTG
jgi:hypothetical protein